MTSRNDYGKRLPVDLRIVRRVYEDPKMSAEQGSEFMSQWGGAPDYVYWARQPVNMRMTYFAIKDGWTDVRDIAAVTELSTRDVSTALTKLENSGVVEPGTITR